MNKPLLLLCIVWCLWLNWSKIAPYIPTPTPTPPHNIISQYDVNKYAGLYCIMDDTVKPDTPTPTPTPVETCQCNKQTGKISYDGGTSLTDCPCVNGTEKCGCVNSSRGDLGEEQTPDPLLSQYYIIEWYGDNCVFCTAWEKQEKPKLEKLGVKTVKLQAIKGSNLTTLGKKHKITSVPRFFICRRDNQKYYTEFINIGFTTAEKLVEDIRNIDSILSKPVEEKPKTHTYQYNRLPRHNPTNWNIVRGRSDFQGYIEHLRYTHGLTNWPLESFSLRTLKDIHSDAHNNNLGTYSEVVR